MEIDINKLIAFIEGSEAIMRFYIEEMENIDSETYHKEYDELVDAYATVKAKKNEAVRQLMHNEEYRAIYRNIDYDSHNYDTDEKKL